MAMLADLMPGTVQSREYRALRAPLPEKIPFRTSDQVELLLTRYQGGSKGPVILAPGFGTSTRAFQLDTIDTNITESLCASGYDVWLLDYRASPALPSSHTQFDLDEIALIDFPAATEKVCELTGASSVQMLGHCVASGTLLMGLLSGKLPLVRSAIASQFLAYVIQPTINKVKAWSHLGFMLERMGQKWLNTDYTGSLVDQLFNDALALYPSSENCGRPVCRRILFMYGEVFKHAQLNAVTHDAVPEMFGVGNIHGFEHLSLIIEAEQLVDAKGHDVYLPGIDHLSTPVCLLQGVQNHIFLEAGGRKTYEWMKGRVPDPSQITYYEIPDYRHMDCFIGANASYDVFPLIVSELDRYN